MAIESNCMFNSNGKVHYDNSSISSLDIKTFFYLKYYLTRTNFHDIYVINFISYLFIRNL